MILTTNIDKAIKICQTERKMRDYVFRGDYEKRRRKVQQMDFVIELLEQCKKELSSEAQQELFKG
jgi:hypothetical protein